MIRVNASHYIEPIGNRNHDPTTLIYEHAELYTNNVKDHLKHSLSDWSIDVFI